MQIIKIQPQAHQSNHLHPTWNHRTRWTSFCTTLCVTLALSACASLGGGNPQELVRQRATERWQALVVGEFSRAYNYNTPGFRAIITPDGYRNRFGNAVTWLGAEVINVNCSEADKCTAQLRIDYKPVQTRQKGFKVSTHIDETWLFEDGQWWYFQKI